MDDQKDGETRIGRVVQESGASLNFLLQVQFLDARGQPDGAPQACRNEAGAKINELVVLRNGCIIAVAESVRVLALEETGRTVRRA